MCRGSGRRVTGDNHHTRGVLIDPNPGKYRRFVVPETAIKPMWPVSHRSARLSNLNSLYFAGSLFDINFN